MATTTLRNAGYNDISDWLPRGGVFRKRKFFQLKGVILTQREGPEDVAEESLRLCIFNCFVMPRKSKLQIELRDLKYSLFFDDLYTFEKWSEALQQAATRRLDEFYTLEERLGSGATAIVYRGISKDTQEEVAIKVIKKAECAPKEIEQFEREAAIVMMANHKCLVRTFDIFETLQQVYMVMEYMRGGTLEERLRNVGHFDESVVRTVMRPVISAVAFLHSIGVVHRDIKPENILCTNKDYPFEPKLADFGLGGILPSELLMLDDDDVEFFDETLGSWYYLSPEQCRKEKYGLKVDVWALGVTMYRLLSGLQPFEGATIPDVIRAVKESKLDFGRSEIFASVSEEAKSLIKGMLHPNPLIRISAEEAMCHPWIGMDETEIYSAKEFSTRASIEMAKLLMQEVPNTRYKQRKSVQKARELRTAIDLIDTDRGHYGAGAAGGGGSKFSQPRNLHINLGKIGNVGNPTNSPRLFSSGSNAEPRSPLASLVRARLQPFSISPQTGSSPLASPGSRPTYDGFDPSINSGLGDSDRLPIFSSNVRHVPSLTTEVGDVSSIAASFGSSGLNPLSSSGLNIPSSSAINASSSTGKQAVHTGIYSTAMASRTSSDSKISENTDYMESRSKQQMLRNDSNKDPDEDQFFNMEELRRHGVELTNQENRPFRSDTNKTDNGLLLTGLAAVRGESKKVSTRTGGLLKGTKVPAIQLAANTPTSEIQSPSKRPPPISSPGTTATSDRSQRNSDNSNAAQSLALNTALSNDHAPKEATTPSATAKQRESAHGSPKLQSVNGGNSPSIALTRKIDIGDVSLEQALQTTSKSSSPEIKAMPTMGKDTSPPLRSPKLDHVNVNGAQTHPAGYPPRPALVELDRDESHSRISPQNTSAPSNARHAASGLDSKLARHVVGGSHTPDPHIRHTNNGVGLRAQQQPMNRNPNPPMPLKMYKHGFVFGTTYNPDDDNGGPGGTHPYEEDDPDNFDPARTLRRSMSEPGSNSGAATRDFQAQHAAARGDVTEQGARHGGEVSTDEAHGTDHMVRPGRMGIDHRDRSAVVGLASISVAHPESATPGSSTRPSKHPSGRVAADQVSTIRQPDFNAARYNIYEHESTRTPPILLGRGNKPKSIFKQIFTKP